MLALRKIILTESKLFLREPIAVGFGILFPTFILLAIGSIPALREPSDEFGGARFVEAWAPSALVVGLGVVALQHIPAVLAGYREKGVLRRMATTPVRPATLLLAQLVVAFTAAAIAAVLVVATAWLMLDVPPPHQPVRFVTSFVVGFGALLAIGMFIAAAAPNERAANGLAVLTYMVTMFLSGAFLPRFAMPETLLKLSAYVPPGPQALVATWSDDPAVVTMAGQVESGSLLAQLGVMVLVAVVAGYPAFRLFRWD